MASERTLIERAFDIAKKGECSCASEVAEKLKAEGFGGGLIERHLEGRRSGRNCRTSVARRR